MYPVLSGMACLYGLLVDLRQVGVQGAGHGVLRGNLVHTVAHYRESIGVEGHVGQQHEDFLVLVHGKILGGGQGHVRYQQTLHGRLLGGVDEADNLVQCTCALEHVLEVEVIVVGESHAAEDDLVHVRTEGHHAEGHHGHHLVVGLVRVGEERNLLSRYQRVVQVDTGDTGWNQL